MTKAKSKRKPASRENDSKTKTRNSVKRTTSQRFINGRGSRRSQLHAAKAKRPTSLQCCERQVARPLRRWHVQRSGNPIRSAASSPVSCARSSASLLSRQTPRTGASTGLRIARRQRRHSAMKRTRSVAQKATRPSLDDEIARLRDLDLHGLQARWSLASDGRVRSQKD